MDRKPAETYGQRAMDERAVRKAWALAYIKKYGPLRWDFILGIICYRYGCRKDTAELYLTEQVNIGLLDITQNRRNRMKQVHAPKGWKGPRGSTLDDIFDKSLDETRPDESKPQD